MHRRISVSAVSSWNWTPEEDLAFWTNEGIDHVGLSVTKLERSGWDPSVTLMKEAGLRFSSVGSVGYFRLDKSASWSRSIDRLSQARALGSDLEAESIVLVSGGAGRLHWEEAATALGAALDPILRDADPAVSGPPLALENTTSQRPDYSFVHTLRDAADLAESIGIGLCLEVNSCWAERGVIETIHRARQLIHLVQVSDFVSGSTVSPDRAVLGDGDIQFEWIIGALLEAGYGGSFEIELIGPRIEEAGYERAIGRSVEYLDALLDRLGA